MPSRGKRLPWGGMDTVILGAERNTSWGTQREKGGDTSQRSFFEVPQRLVLIINTSGFGQ